MNEGPACEADCTAPATETPLPERVNAIDVPIGEYAEWEPLYDAVERGSTVVLAMKQGQGKTTAACRVVVERVRGDLSRDVHRGGVPVAIVVAPYIALLHHWARVLRVALADAGITGQQCAVVVGATCMQRAPTARLRILVVTPFYVKSSVVAVCAEPLLVIDELEACVALLCSSIATPVQVLGFLRALSLRGSGGFSAGRVIAGAALSVDLVRVVLGVMGIPLGEQVTWFRTRAGDSRTTIDLRTVDEYDLVVSHMRSVLASGGGVFAPVCGDHRWVLRLAERVVRGFDFKAVYVVSPNGRASACASLPGVTTTVIVPTMHWRSSASFVHAVPDDCRLIFASNCASVGLSIEGDRWRDFQVIGVAKTHPQSLTQGMGRLRAPAGGSRTMYVNRGALAREERARTTCADSEWAEYASGAPDAVPPSVPVTPVQALAAPISPAAARIARAFVLALPPSQRAECDGAALARALVEGAKPDDARVSPFVGPVAWAGALAGITFRAGDLAAPLRALIAFATKKEPLCAALRRHWGTVTVMEWYTVAERAAEVFNLGPRDLDITACIDGIASPTSHVLVVMETLAPVLYYYTAPRTALKPDSRIRAGTRKRLKAALDRFYYEARSATGDDVALLRRVLTVAAGRLRADVLTIPVGRFRGPQTCRPFLEWIAGRNAGRGLAPSRELARYMTTYATAPPSVDCAGFAEAVGAAPCVAGAFRAITADYASPFSVCGVKLTSAARLRARRAVLSRAFAGATLVDRDAKLLWSMCRFVVLGSHTSRQL